MSNVPVGRPPVSRTMSDYMENTLGDNDHLHVSKKVAPLGACDKYFMCEDESWCCANGGQRAHVEFENNSSNSLMLVFSEVEIDWSSLGLPSVDVAKETYSAVVEGVGQVMRHTIRPYGTACFEFHTSVPFFCTIIVLEETSRIQNANWPIMASLADAPTCNVYLLKRNNYTNRSHSNIRGTMDK